MVEKTPDKKKEEENSKSSKKLGFSSPRLELKKTIGGGTVRQSFSHGRTKSVSVEVKKVRSYKAFDATKEAQINNSNNKDMGLSEEETEARLKAINNSIKKKESILEEKIEEINKEPRKVSEENKKESKKESNIIEKEINDIIPAPLKETDSDKSIRLRKEEEA